MSRLDELIKELCPDGVEHHKLNDVCDINKGVQLNKADMADEGTYPVINGGVNPSGFIEQYNQEANTITISQGGASAGYVNWLDTPFWAGAHCYVVTPNETVLNRYLFHFIKSKESELQECQYGAGIPALNKKTVAILSIPVPPIEIQEEIVKTLDKFTNYVTELTAELTARRTQFEYYRNKLVYSDGYELVDINDISKLSAGGDAPKTHMSKEKNEQYTIPIYSNGIAENALYGYTDEAKVNVPCITLAARGTIGWAALRKDPFYPIIRLICLIPNNEHDIRYIKYAIDTLEFHVPDGGIPQLTVPMLKKYKLPIHSKEKESEIADVLDKFSKLCDDISEGLPAEIEARQKQYDYYRDKLLSFKEKEN